jgi:TRAP-type C4-dicarboxylate transport system permease small subunit
MSRARRTLRYIDQHAEEAIIVVIFTYFILIIAVEVTLRYVFNSSTLWGEETASHAFVWISWIAASQAAKKRVHISISIIDRYLSDRGKFAMAYFYNGLFILLCLFGIRYVWTFIDVYYRYNTLAVAARYPMYLVYAAVPIGYCLMIYRVVQNMLVDYRDMKSGKPLRQGMEIF